MILPTFGGFRVHPIGGKKTFRALGLGPRALGFPPPS